MGENKLFFDDLTLGMTVDIPQIDFFDEELLAGKSTKTERLKPVFENDILSGRATITDLVKQNNKNGLVEVSIDVHSQNGELVLKDITEVIMKCKNTIEN